MTPSDDARRAALRAPTAVPHSPAAEKSMLGAALLAEAAREVLARELTPDDFYLPRNGHICSAVQDMHRLGAQIDAVTVAAKLDESGLLAACGGVQTLIEYAADTPATTSAPTYAATIRDRAARRRLMAVTIEGGLRAQALDVEVGDTTEYLTGEVARIALPGGYDDLPVPNVDEFLAVPVEYDWLVPNLLERGDRVIITAGEGGGKSTFCRQFAVQLSAGIHPFQRGSTFEAVKVLLVDVENSRGQVARQLRPMIQTVRPVHQAQLGQGLGYDPDRLRIELRTRGMDLLKREDRRWFTDRVEKVRPDIVITGPLYKMYAGNPNDEEHAKHVADYLDELRHTYGVAILLEAHSPHGTDGGRERTLRPRGASLWMGWPEFGYGIRKCEGELGDQKVYDFIAWRGARDADRPWPSRIKHGQRFPWVPHLDGELPAPAPPRGSYLPPASAYPDEPWEEEPF